MKSPRLKLLLTSFKVGSGHKWPPSVTWPLMTKAKTLITLWLWTLNPVARLATTSLSHSPTTLSSTNFPWNVFRLTRGTCLGRENSGLCSRVAFGRPPSSSGTLTPIKVAVKKLRAGGALEPDAVGAFLRELQIMTFVGRHENIVQLLGACTRAASADSIFMVLGLHAHESQAPRKRATHTCTHCDKGWVSRAALFEHLRTHTGEKPFRCGSCGKSCRTSSNLRSHQQTHSSLRPYGCPDPECGIAFGHKSSLTTHLKIHTGEKPFNCALSGKAFSTNKSRMRHQERHTGEKPYKCTYCRFECASNRALTQHSRLHTGESPFYCQECGRGRSFQTQGSLTKYMIRQHSRTQGIDIGSVNHNHACDLCDKKFKGKFDLRSHISTVHAGPSSEVGCQICGKSFKHKHYLAQHMRSHTTGKQHICEFCDRPFKHRATLRVHVKSHTGEKPYTCSVDDCLRAFSSNHSLIRHQETHQLDRVRGFACEWCPARFYKKYFVTRHAKMCKRRPSS